MSIFAAVMTGTGTGALSTIQVFGDTAEALIQQLFTPAGSEPLKFEAGRILLGSIRNGDEVIDQVTIGCEGPETFAIHCHGNPLLVEKIMQLLRRRGATLLTAEQLLSLILKARGDKSAIAIEAKLAEPKIKTLTGTKIVTSQINAGLTRKAQAWLSQMDKMPIEAIKTEAAKIIEASQAAKLIIYGCTAVLAGPPNSGKSTLLNYFAGRQKSIVTDIEGTTRDWVEATCRFGPLSVTLIDTAGLAQGSRPDENTIEQAAQEKTAEVLSRADFVMLVLDNSQPAEKLADYIIERITGKKVITVLNKSDLPAEFDAGKLPGTLSNAVQISAKRGDGIDDLKEKILQACNAADFNHQHPACFTSRQENLLEQITNTPSKQQAASKIAELLNGHVAAS